MNKKLKIFLILLTMVFLFVFLGVLSYLKDRIVLSPSGTVGNTPGNLNNGGLFCEANGKVYFSNPYDSGHLYCMNPDGTKIQKLLSTKVKFLCADHNYLYYYQQTSSGKAGLGYVLSTYGIYRSNFKAKQIECLTRDTAFAMQLFDNHVYYTTTSETGPELRKIKIDKSESKVLAHQAINPACAAEDVIYYNGVESNHYLYSLSAGNDTSSVVWQGNLWYPVYDNGYIYYLDVENNYRLCRYSLSGDLVEILTHDRVDCFNVGSGYIYYQANSVSSPALKKMNTDGSNVEIVSEGNYTEINMTSRYVYFKLFGTDSPLYQVPIGSASVSTFDGALNAAMEELE